MDILPLLERQGIGFHVDFFGIFSPESFSTDELKQWGVEPEIGSCLCVCLWRTKMGRFLS